MLMTHGINARSMASACRRGDPAQPSADACIETVGLEAHGPTFQYAYDRTKQSLILETDRPIALRQAITSCCNGEVAACR